MKKIARKEFWMQSDLQVFTSIKKKKNLKIFCLMGVIFLKKTMQIQSKINTKSLNSALKIGKQSYIYILS